MKVVAQVWVCLMLCDISRAELTRAEEIEALREEKAKHLRPERVSGIHRTILYVKKKKLVERFTYGVAGFRSRLGGLGPGSGFAVGVEYFRPDLARERMTFRTSAAASQRDFYLLDMQFTAPRLADGKVFLDLLARSQRSPSIDYYGPDAGSFVTNRTVYSLEDTSAGIEGGLKLGRKVRVGGIGRYLAVNVGRGQDRRYRTTESLFTEQTSPGLGTQSNFLQGGAFVDYDTRDIAGGARHGSRSFVQFLSFDDRDARQYSFHRLDVDLQQHFGFTNDRRVIAMRARTVLTGTDKGNRVPFYLQPQLGGANDLRGFQARRFYGNNSLVLNGEYRWEVFAGLDMALFMDAGKVFATPGSLNLAGLEKSYGLGFRFTSDKRVFWRTDVAYSREGIQVWLTFQNIF